jgi:hypothetical protein
MDFLEGGGFGVGSPPQILHQLPTSGNVRSTKRACERMETSADKPLIIIPANYDNSRLTDIMGLRVKQRHFERSRETAMTGKRSALNYYLEQSPIP